MPVGPSSDLPSVTCLALSLADKAALSSLALGRPALGKPLHNQHYVKPGTGFSVQRYRTGCARRPLKGAPPWPSRPPDQAERQPPPA